MYTRNHGSQDQLVYKPTGCFEMQASMVMVWDAVHSFPWRPISRYSLQRIAMEE